MTWIDGPLLGFDTETTGVNPQSDRIVTAALVHRSDGETRVRTWLADPGIEIPAAASAVHHITTEYARARGRPAAEVVDEVAGEVAEALRAGTPVVAFNAAYDLTLLEAELARHGLTSLVSRIGGPIEPVVDPLVLDRKVDRYRRGKRTLELLCEHYRVQPAAGGLHAAEVDVVATLDVLAAIVARNPELAQQALGDLHALQVGAHRDWATGLNRWRQEQGLHGPGAALDWPVRVP